MKCTHSVTIQGCLLKYVSFPRYPWRQTVNICSAQDICFISNCRFFSIFCSDKYLQSYTWVALETSLETRLDGYETYRWYCPILIITARICRDISLKLSNTEIIANYFSVSEIVRYWHTNGRLTNKHGKEKW